MSSYAWTEQDLKQMSSLGISPSEVQRQLELFRNPPSSIQLLKPALLNDGIFCLSDAQINLALKNHELARVKGRFIKFVPASGAASRMFQLLFKFTDQNDLNHQKLENDAQSGNKEALLFLNFITQLSKLAFYDELNLVMKMKGLNLDNSLQTGKYDIVLRYLLSIEGLDYAQKPKGLVFFHKYERENRTPFHEHLVEAKAYCGADKIPVRIHFTVSNEHLENFKNQFEIIKKDEIFIRAEFSIQTPSTQTIAVDKLNQPFRDEKEKLVFRPGGHGALIENLNHLQGDLIYIKNVDNVTIESCLGPTILWKKILGGFLVEIQDKIFSILKKLNQGMSEEEMSDVIKFCKNQLCLDLGSNMDTLSLEEKKEILKKKLNRPIRICGVVRNTGEPGGGPFWVKDAGNRVSLQIVENAQVDGTNPDQRKIFEKSTHFNPVDLICGVKDWHGKSFNLRDFTDPLAVFMSPKSVNGVEIKALELPGLWNGAMADWITLFVEVPIETFNPVKTVFDLLKPAHQNGLLLH